MSRNEIELPQIEIGTIDIWEVIEDLQIIKGKLFISENNSLRFWIENKTKLMEQFASDDINSSISIYDLLNLIQNLTMIINIILRSIHDNNYKKEPEKLNIYTFLRVDLDILNSWLETCKEYILQIDNVFSEPLSRSYLNIVNSYKSILEFFGDENLIAKANILDDFDTLKVTNSKHF